MDPWLRDRYAGVHGEPLRRRTRHPAPMTVRRSSVRRADELLGELGRRRRGRRAAMVVGLLVGGAVLVFSVWLLTLDVLDTPLPWLPR